MPSKTKKPLAYRRVPVSDVIIDDANLPRTPLQRYDWTGIGDKAVEVAKSNPDGWLLVDDDAPTSTASNISEGKYTALKAKRFIGWKFRGKVSDVTLDANGRRRAKIWIRATRDEPVL